MFGFGLITLILPPINSIKSFEIVAPRPKPPYFLPIEPSTCVKELKIFLILFFSIPIPVSSTENFIFNSSSVFFLNFSFIMTSPFSVYFIAFSIKLDKICNKRFASPKISFGISFSILRINLIFFSLALK